MITLAVGNELNSNVPNLADSSPKRRIFRGTVFYEAVNDWLREKEYKMSKINPSSAVVF